jgi:hypothetical protein
LVQDALLVGRDELHATPELVALAVLVAHGASVAGVIEDVDEVLAPVDLVVSAARTGTVCIQAKGKLTGAGLAKRHDGHGGDDGGKLHFDLR